MKFLADMGISPKTVNRLQSLGHDAVHLNDLGLSRMPDVAILQKARQEDQIILTNDLDFSDLLAAGGYTLPSVIIFRLKDMRAINVNHYMDKILTGYQDELARGVVMSVRENRIRAHKLPIKPK
jgi:predicted nuclease of predicted toxin-antitoxin system